MILAKLTTATQALDGSDDIQLFPPGKHTITPLHVDEDGKRTNREFTVIVDEHVAQAVEDCRKHYQAEADAGQGDVPYLDFNHEDAAASALVLRVYWGGEDPLKGGVRAKVEWTEPGDAARKGKAYRRVSPAFYLDDDSKAEPLIVGAPVNMGGLVNKAAFRAIAPLLAKYDGAQNFETEDHKPNKNIMTEEEIKQLKAELATLSAANEALKKQIAALEKDKNAMQEADADQAIAQAVQEGRIAPGDEVKAKWRGLILKDPSAKEILASQPVNPAFADVYQAKDNKPVTQDDGKTLLAKYDKLTGPERMDFFRKNKVALIAAKSTK